MTMDTALNINKTLALRFKSFVNNNNELIIIPRINLYISLNDVNTNKDFMKKILHWCTWKGASNHWDNKGSPSVIQYINWMLGTSFNKDEIDLIYTALGNGVNEPLTDKFIDSGYDINILMEAI